jgi:hypothetical protein
VFICGFIIKNRLKKLLRSGNKNFDSAIPVLKKLQTQDKKMHAGAKKESDRSHSEIKTPQ